MNKEFIRHSIETLTVTQLYWVLVASARKLQDDLGLKLSDYRNAKSCRTYLGLEDALVEISCRLGTYNKLLEALSDVLDQEDEKDSPGETQFADWLPTTNLRYKIEALIDLL